jgi:hypothetical protein
VVPLSKLLHAAGKLHAPLLPPLGLGLTAFAVRKAGIAFLSPQLLDLLRWGRSLSTTKAARELGFRASLDTTTAFEDFIRQRRVLRYEPDRHGYQYEKELEDFIHSRQVPSLNGEGEANGAMQEPSGGAKRRLRPHRRPAPHRSHS